MKPAPSFADTTDRQLLLDLKRLAHAERQATAELIACLAEVDARRLYLGEGCSSLFTYCTQVLHLSEHAAYGRIEAARAVRRFPLVLEMLVAGALTLTAVSLLRPHLTDANHADLLTAARHKSKRDVEQLVAALQAKPDVAPCIRKLPSNGTAAAPATALSFDVSPDDIGAESRASRATAPWGPTPRAVISPLGAGALQAAGHACLRRRKKTEESAVTNLSTHSNRSTRSGPSCKSMAGNRAHRTLRDENSAANARGSER
jgi:hypothetical protein